tara:strand:+ start:4442 stop:6028 length:1587 start_codon:yes stop_codon:yes gene_type:complete
MDRARDILLLSFLIFGAIPHQGTMSAQELVGPRWNVGAWTPKATGIWPAIEQKSDTANQAPGIQGFGTIQYSPGAIHRGAFWNWPSAGGTGWQLGMTWDWSKNQFYTFGHADHWRIAGVHEDDWNEAWQWGTWGGMGLAWNPSEADIALVRMVGTLGYAITPSLAFEVGNQRHHWGKGWRSLWLDRQAAPLPFARIVLKTDRISYVHMIGRTQHLTVGSPLNLPGLNQPPPGAIVDKRGSWLASHAIDLEIGTGWTGTLFGAVTWLANDSGYTSRFEPVYTLPVVAFRPAEYALGSADNAMVGAALAWVPRWAKNTLQFYGQMLLDELVVSQVFSPERWWGNKWGLLGTITYQHPRKEWGAVVEACAIRPYTYSHAAPAQGWTHNRQPLAHPAGSNFIEARAHVRWESGEWKLHAGIVLRRQGADEAVELDKEPEFSIGSNPLLSYITRPTDFGVDLIYTGSGIAGATDLLTQRLWWFDIGRDIPRLNEQQVFVRAMQNHSAGDLRIENWWRLECGIRLNRILEERNW